MGPTPIATRTPVATAQPTSAPTATPIAFTGWPTYGYDNHRDGFNPTTTGITAASIAGLHLAWQINYQTYNSQAQPILAPNVGGHRGVLFVGGGTGIAYALDATTGQQLWSQSLGQMPITCSLNGQTAFGIGGTMAYDAASQSLYVPANVTSGNVSIVRLAAASGTELGRIAVTPNPLAGEANLTHASLALAGGRVYLGTGSTCDLSSWRGRVVAADMNLTGIQTFFTTFDRGGAYSGGGVWGWGGVAIDDGGNVLTGVGNADTATGSSGPQPPFVQQTSETVGFGNAFVKLAPDLSSALASNAPGFNGVDLDMTGSPVLYRPFGCSDSLASLQTKSGELITYDSQTFGGSNGPVDRTRISPSTANAPYLGNPGFSPVTGMIYAPVETSAAGIAAPGMIAFATTGCNGTTRLIKAWQASFGPDSFNFLSGTPRSGVSVTAGGVVFVGTPCNADGSGGCLASLSTPGGAVWALDATTGLVLNGGKPIVITGDIIRMPPVIDGNWVFITDNSANLYAFTTDASVPARSVMRAFADPRSRGSLPHRRR